MAWLTSTMSCKSDEPYTKLDYYIIVAQGAARLLQILQPFHVSSGCAAKSKSKLLRRE